MSGIEWQPENKSNSIPLKPSTEFPVLKKNASVFLPSSNKNNYGIIPDKTLFST